MKMHSVLVPLLITSGSLMYAMQFPVYEDHNFYRGLVAHAQGMLKPLPSQIKAAQEKLQQLLAGNPNQAVISRVIDDLVKLLLQQFEMDLTLVYVDRAAQFARLCDKKIAQQKAEGEALQNQESLRASTGIEAFLPSSGIMPEAVMPESVTKSLIPLAPSQEEEEESSEPKLVPQEETDEEEEKEEKPVTKKQFEKLTESKGKAEALKQTAIYNEQLKSIKEEAGKLQEQEKQGTAPAGWYDYIMKKYQDTKNWYFGTGTQEE